MLPKTPTKRSGLRYGSGLIKAASTKAKMATLAAMPKARTITAVLVKVQFARSWRSAKWVSWRKLSRRVITLQHTAPAGFGYTGKLDSLVSWYTTEYLRNENMLRIIVLAALSAAAGIGADTSVNGLWSELKSKRDALSSVHQEFAVTQTFKTSHGEQASKRQVVVDLAPGRWRETSVSGSGKRIRIFDGSD